MIKFLLIALFLFYNTHADTLTKVFVGHKNIYGDDVYKLNDKLMYKTAQIFLVIYFNPGGENTNKDLKDYKFFLVSQKFYVSYPNDVENIYAEKCLEFYNYFKSGYCVGYRDDFPSTKEEVDNFQYQAMDEIKKLLNCEDCLVRYYKD